MSAPIEIRRLNLDEFTAEELQSEAQRLRRFVYDDFIRLGVPDDEARSFSDPTDEEQIQTQFDKILFPRHPDTIYAKLSSGNETAGYAKIGPRLAGDEAPFGRGLRFLASMREMTVSSGDMPRSLHVFSVREGLARAALTRIYYDLIPAHQQLVASVHEADSELQDAFTDLGASTAKTSGIITLGSYAASYSRRVLPPHRVRHQ